MTERKYSDEELAWVYARLLRLAKVLIGGRKRPLKAAGKEPRDYVQETFKMFYQNEGKYDSTKRSLFGYLAYNFMRGLISDDYKDRKRDIKTEGQHEFQEREELLEIANMIDTYVAEQMDHDIMISRVLDVLKDDPIALAVYKGRFLESAKYQEICNEHGISKKEAYNAVRKIERALVEIRKKHDIQGSYGKKK